jgi:hypothetical protein
MSRKGCTTGVYDASGTPSALECDQLWPKIQEKARAGARTGKRRPAGRKDSPARKKFDQLLRDYAERLAPRCPCNLVCRDRCHLKLGPELETELSSSRKI